MNKLFFVSFLLSGILGFSYIAASEEEEKLNEPNEVVISETEELAVPEQIEGLTEPENASIEDIMATTPGDETKPIQQEMAPEKQQEETELAQPTEMTALAENEVQEPKEIEPMIPEITEPFEQEIDITESMEPVTNIPPIAESQPIEQPMMSEE